MADVYFPNMEVVIS